MRIAKLFTLNERDVRVIDSKVRLLEMPRFDPMNCAFIDSGEVLESVREIALPVERIWKIEHGKMKEHFIAMSPDLREILEAPFKTRIAMLEDKLLIADRTIDEQRAKVAEYQDRITAFNALPWYKRWFSHP